jgi:hypothetical protein
MRQWFVHFPGNAYAYEFPGETINDAKQAARDWLGVKRLPNGTDVWSKSPDHDTALLEDAKRDPELYLWR